MPPAHSPLHTKCKAFRNRLLVKKYTEDLIKYAKGEIKKLEIIPSVRPWTDEEIQKESERIINNPTRLDRIRAFSQFVNSESHNLISFGDLEGFLIPNAYNFADVGPIAAAAEKIVEAEKRFPFLLQHPVTRPPYNPHPALLMTMEGHTERIVAVSVTPDGQWAVSESADKTLRLWDLKIGNCLKTIDLGGDTDSFRAISITPDGRRAISGVDDNALRLWDVETGECLKIIEVRNWGISDSYCNHT